VTSPTAVNLNVGSFPEGVGGNKGSNGGEGDEGFVYPDGRTPVAVRGEAPTVSASVEGSPQLLGAPATAEREGGAEEEGGARAGQECDPGNPNCGSFVQDAYDDAYY